MTLASGLDRSGPPDPTPDAPSGAGTEVPVPAQGLELVGEVSGSGYRRPPSLARRIDGQTIQLTRLLYLMLEAIDGHRDTAAIAATVSDSYGRRVTASDVERLIESKLRPLGLLTT